MKIKLICCIGLDYDTELISHFCKHYSKYNIYSFHFILNKANDFEIKDYSEHFSNLPTTLPFIGAKLNFEKWIGNFNDIDKIDKFNDIIKHSNESHILLSDIDEFQQHTKSITSNYVWGKLIDREPINGKTKKVTEQSIEEQFPIQSNRSNWKYPIKPCIFPSSERLANSHHLKDESNITENKIKIYHYRWTSTRLKKSKDRYNIFTEVRNSNKRFNSGHKQSLGDSKKLIGYLKDNTLF
tara:strand:+ start:187 stop:906 length:720 start_codon:yes stop_codon:yes gene_type:complete